MNIEDMSEKGLENLRLGIVEQAAEDYISLLANFETSSSDCNLKECRTFFRSQWFQVLCNIEPEHFMKILESRARFMMVLEYEIHKEHGSSRWYVTAVGSKQPIPGTYGTKTRALHTAAEMNNVDYKHYMKMRRREGKA